VGLAKLPDNFYDKIKPFLHKRIGRELRLAYRILDLGCGDCQLVRYMANTYDQKVTGVDISSGNLPDYRDITKKNKNIKCIRKDAENLKSFYGAVDAIVIMWSLHEMEHPQRVLRQAHRALRPGGEILIVEFPRGSLAQRLWDEDYYNKDEIVNFLLKAGFENVQAKLIERKQILWIKGCHHPNLSGKRC